MVHLTAFAIPWAEYFRIRRAGQPQNQHRKIHCHERADEKILKTQSSAMTEKRKVAAADQECCLQSGILFTNRYK